VGVALPPASPDSGNACGRFADQCGPLLASVRLLLRFLAEEIRWNKRFGRPSQRTIKSIWGASPESVEAEWLLELRRLSEPDVIFVHVRRRVFCNRKPGLRLDTAWWVEDAELLDPSI
jgi:hypothetical protein